MIDKEKKICTTIGLIVETMQHNEVLPDIGLSAMLNLAIEIAYDHSLEKDELLKIISDGWDQYAQRNPKKKSKCRMIPNTLP